MAGRVVLHVGLMKSGTSYLQRRVFAAQDMLAGRGLVVPGERWRRHVRAVADVLDRAGPPDAPGQWRWFLDEVVAARSRGDDAVLLSMEFLGPALPEQIDRVRDDLRAAGAERVEAVATVRDLGRSVPAMWQESLQNRGTTAWGDYVDGLAGDAAPARAFWRQQGAGRIVANWADGLGADAVTVVTVPGPGAASDVLWDRFCEAVGVDCSDCPEVPPVNTSLDAASSRVLRELNAALDGEVDRPTYNRLVKARVAKDVLAGRRGDTIGFAPPEWLHARSARLVERITATGARVVGDLAELEPLATPGVDPADVPGAEVAAAAVAALRGLVLDRTPAP